MFDKSELSVLLRSLETYKIDVMVNCIYCDIVYNRSEYAKTRYCVECCDVCNDIEEINSLIYKIQEALK